MDPKKEAANKDGTSQLSQVWDPGILSSETTSEAALLSPQKGIEVIQATEMAAGALAWLAPHLVSLKA